MPNLIIVSTFLNRAYVNCYSLLDAKKIDSLHTDSWWRQIISFSIHHQWLYQIFLISALYRKSIEWDKTSDNTEKTPFQPWTSFLFQKKLNSFYCQRAGYTFLSTHELRIALNSLECWSCEAIFRMSLRRMECNMCKCKE